MNWNRQGPPRPGGGLGGHPTNHEIPWVHRTDEDEANRRRELDEEKKSRGLVIKTAEWKAKFGRPYPLSEADKALIEKHWGLV
jgi:hypothetical protein